MIERFKLLLREMNRGIYEKETEISLSLLAALAGESIILLGPPGVAKSMVARQLKNAFRDAHSFEYLMSRFSTPDEIFGPVSIQKLKTSDTYERAVDGYLPTADVVACQGRGIGGTMGSIRDSHREPTDQDGEELPGDALGSEEQFRSEE